MTARTLIAITLILGLAACESRFNPFNWFSGGEETVALYPEGGFPVDNDPRVVVSEVSELVVLRASGGAIIRATGIPPRQGYWDGELVAENDETPVNGVLTYVFRVAEPFVETRASTPYSRQVIVAHFISDTKLAGVSQIRVLGELNSRTARR